MVRAALDKNRPSSPGVEDRQDAADLCLAFDAACRVCDLQHTTRESASATEVRSEIAVSPNAIPTFVVDVGRLAGPYSSKR